MGRRINIWYWNHEIAIIFWIALFIGLGPLQLLANNTTYQGSFFNNNPVAYFMLQGFFIATFAVGVVYLVDWLVKKRRSVNPT